MVSPRKDLGLRIDEYSKDVFTGSTAIDTAALNWAINNVPERGSVIIPSGLGDLNVDPTGVAPVSRSMSIVGDNNRPTIRSVTPGVLFDVQANDVTVDSLTVVGDDINNPANIAVGNSNATAAAPVTGLEVANLATFSTWASVYLEHMQDFLVNRCRFDAPSFAGVGTLSCIGGRISDTTVRDLTSSWNGQSYGFHLTRLSEDSLAVRPRSGDIVVSNCLVDGAPWEAYSTHGGEHIVFDGCVAKNTNRGAAFVPADNSAGDEAFATRFCAATGCSFSSGVDDGSAASGVVVKGAFQGGAFVDFAQGTVVQATLDRFGPDGVETTGALTCSGTRGTVADVSCYRPANAGIMMYFDNFGFRVSGVVEDPWSDIGSRAYGFSAPSSPNAGSVCNFSVYRGSLTKINVLTIGAQMQTNAANRVVLSGCDLDDATTAVVGPQFTAGQLP